MNDIYFIILTSNNTKNDTRLYIKALISSFIEGLQMKALQGFNIVQIKMVCLGTTDPFQRVDCA